MNRYEKPTRRRRRKPAAVVTMAGLAPPGPAAVAGVQVAGIEVTQAVQDLNNSVRLIADKATLVRVYLRPTGLAQPTRVTGELSWRRGGVPNLLPAMNRVTLIPANPASIQQQRGSLELSINFRLPDGAISAGPLEIAFTRAFVPGGANLAIGTVAPTGLNFVKTPPLRLRAVGLRYRHPGVAGTVTPDAMHFAFLRSFLLRAYPIAQIEWSQIVVDADATFRPPFGDGASDLVNIQLMALRSRDIDGGLDARTRYYGLVANASEIANSTMRGSAVLTEATRVFDKVGSGPAGVPNGWSGDFDASFADWYGAHEIGHTCQRFHPGFPPPNVNGGQDRSDVHFPYPEGLISPIGGATVGFDIGDAALGLPMQVLPGDVHHDIMTYEDRQWLSPYTYHAIHDELVREG